MPAASDMIRVYHHCWFLVGSCGRTGHLPNAVVGKVGTVTGGLLPSNRSFGGRCPAPQSDGRRILSVIAEENTGLNTEISVLVVFSAQYSTAPLRF